MLHNGSASAFQADGAGSIPAIRSGGKMPTYTYSCDDCGPKEFVHGMDESLTSCPHCDSISFRKTFNNIGIQFKGKGFYSTDSRGKDGKSN